MEKGLGRFLGILCQDSSDSKSNRLNVVIFRFFYLLIWGVYPIHSSTVQAPITDHLRDSINGNLDVEK